jgi:DNA-binding SARP family transcriptional activator
MQLRWESAVLDVSLFGGASFFVNGALVRSDLGAAGRVLAGYLFEFPGRVHRRERLADLFWPDSDPDKARSALNTAVWRIRKILEFGSKGAGRSLISSGDDVILERSHLVRVDTHQFEGASRLVLEPRNGGVTPSNGEIHEVTIALGNYAGPFLDGFDGDWVLQERERLHCLFIRASFELMRMAALKSQYEIALEFGRKILAIDPLRESIQRDVMLLLVLNGQRVEAIRTYQRLSELLKLELGVATALETQHLRGEILSGEIFNRLQEYVFSHFGTRST